MGLRFEWDQFKAKENYARHGISFDSATAVFSDPFALEFRDDRKDYGEDRFVIVELAEGHVLYVAYTERDEAMRIISAWRATKHEQEAYFE